MATHSSILAWRIPWTEELGGLQSIVCKESNMTEATQHAIYNKSFVILNISLSPMLILCAIYLLKKTESVFL